LNFTYFSQSSNQIDGHESLLKLAEGRKFWIEDVPTQEQWMNLRCHVLIAKYRFVVVYEDLNTEWYFVETMLFVDVIIIVEALRGAQCFVVEVLRHSE
jgi:hypothetical protein